MHVSGTKSIYIQEVRKLKRNTCATCYSNMFIKRTYAETCQIQKIEKWNLNQLARECEH